MKTGLFVIAVLVNLRATLCDYWSERESLIKNDQEYILGSEIVLTTKEKLVNDLLMSYKMKEVDEGFRDPGTFLAAQHFFYVKEKIEQSEVFRIIKEMPKGASLHSHDEATVSQEFLYNLTFTPNLYGCDKQGVLYLHFFSKDNTTNECNWTLISDFRANNKTFDMHLKQALTMERDDPINTYSNENIVWSVFQNIFKTITGMISYKPVFENFFYEALKELYYDNVKYLELRGFLPQVYDLTGKIYSEVEVVGIYHDTLIRFKRDFPDFFDAKFIYAPSRHVDAVKMNEYLNTYTKIKAAYPDFVIGFDLVGQEDKGAPLTDFVSQIIELQKSNTKVFFHAGETNWYGSTTDYNLFDAVLLNTTRIGHGYALLKHPAVAKIVKERKIAVEVCPISNQVLRLVDDVRNHPGTLLIAQGFPVVIAADDPALWGATGLSYDWYYAFMGMTSKWSDLRFLKKLAINSIMYSGLNGEDQMSALIKWNRDWQEFIDTTLRKNFYEIRNVIIV